MLESGDGFLDVKDLPALLQRKANLEDCVILHPSSRVQVSPFSSLVTVKKDQGFFFFFLQIVWIKIILVSMMYSKGILMMPYHPCIKRTENQRHCSPASLKFPGKENTVLQIPQQREVTGKKADGIRPVI